MLHNEKMQKFLIYSCAIVPSFFAIAWIITFGFTNYRQHLAYIVLPLGIAMGILSVGMILLKRWAIIVSIALAVFTMIASILIFSFDKSLLSPAIIIVGVIYVYSSLLYLRSQKMTKT